MDRKIRKTVNKKNREKWVYGRKELRQKKKKQKKIKRPEVQVKEKTEKNGG